MRGRGAPGELTLHVDGAPVASVSLVDTAAGMLSPVAELECADADVFALGLRSLDLWPEVIAGLSQPVDLHRRGSLLLAHRGDEGAAHRVVDLMAAKAPAGHQPQRLESQQLAQLEPDAARMAHAWLLPCEGQIDTVQAMGALAAGALAAGAVFHWARAVESVAGQRVSWQTVTAGPDTVVCIECTNLSSPDSLWHHPWSSPPSPESDNETRTRGARADRRLRGGRGRVAGRRGLRSDL